MFTDLEGAIKSGIDNGRQGDHHDYDDGSDVDPLQRCV